ncbi:flavodoxin family protein [Lutispora saccharofermentans]|uniref:Uncharacterized protein n=1 Tax=Lutispora saccharofermentans TaxID=3024236 RepID=A0ABT1NJQ1_9FIRM|nr:hypothetical protein [Lutispora saccharofermentans]MCQ1530511.1 hypothetical protein [Lutispora saccharofermentans]
MSIAVVSYSMTGNNEALAANLAKAISAEHIRITEAKKRSYGTITLDITFNRTPHILPEPQTLDKYDGIIFVAPVWMGQPAFPLRSYLKYIKLNPRKYGFVSISGGSLNPNPQLCNNITRRAGIAPAVFINMYIADLLPKDAKIDPKAVEVYKLTESDLDSMTVKAVKEIKKHFE